MNFVAARVTAVYRGKATRASGEVGALPIAATLRGASAGVGAEVTLGFRPEHVLSGEGTGIRGLVKVVEQLGSVSYLYLEAEGGAAVTLEQRRLTGIRP